MLNEKTHKWLWFPMNIEFGPMIGYNWDYGQGRWKCEKCGSITTNSMKPKTNRDYKRQDINKNCSEELINTIMST